MSNRSEEFPLKETLDLRKTYLKPAYQHEKPNRLVAWITAGKAFDDWNNFGEADWRFSYGTGGRYLLARKFKLRVGIDLAHGPGTWAYYIVFGSNWLQ